MKRTIREWLEHIADPIVRERALENINPVRSHAESINEAIMVGFKWEDTPEGDYYWCDIHLSDIELLPFND